MHNPDYTINATLHSGSGSANSLNKIEFRYTPSQANASATFLTTDQKLCDLIADKVQQKEFFYGIEISAHNFGAKKSVLDYNIFGAMMPLFTSLIWFGADYAQIERIAEVESIQSARALESHVPHVMPHFTAYRVDKDRLSEFLELNFTNVLALRGDQYDAKQEFKYATDMIAKMRQIRGDTISIGVGGYPEGHMDSKSLDEDIDFLAKKVNAGADFIISQVCFSSDAIISFVRRCRAKGITVPIIVGILVPANQGSLYRMMDITGARLSRAQKESYKDLSDDIVKFRDYAIDSAATMITEILDSNLGIYGFQFFTLNRFRNVQKVLERLTEKRLTNELKR